MKPYETAMLVRTYYDLQDLRIRHGARTTTLEKIEKRHGAQPSGLELVGMDHLEAAEKALYHKIDAATKEHPIAVEFLRCIRGIGPVLSGGIIALIETRSQVRAILKDGREDWVTDPDVFPNEKIWLARKEVLGIVEILEKKRTGIECFDTVSKLWAYAGMAIKNGEIQRMKKGEQGNYSPLFKVLMWKIGESFVKSGKSYKALYDSYKARLRIRQPERPGEGANTAKKGGKWSDGHLHAMAKRYVAKMFLRDVYCFWREHENLPVRVPYEQEYLGHTTSHSWVDMMDR